MNQQLPGLPEKNVRVSGFLFHVFARSNCLAIVMLFGMLVSAHVSGKQVSGLTGFYRNGQVFLTWKNVPNPDNYYKVYRSASPIIDGSQLSDCEYLGWTNQYSAKDHDMSAHYNEDRSGSVNDS